MNRQDFIEGFKWGVTFGKFAPKSGHSEKAINEQAEYEWELYSEGQIYNKTQNERLQPNGQTVEEWYASWREV